MRARLEAAFAGLAGRICRHPLVALGLALALLAGTAAPLRQLRFEASMVTLFHERDPARVAYERYQRLFGKGDMLIVLLEPPSETGIFDRRFLGELEALHQALERRLPHVAEVTSLVNVRRTRGDQSGQLIVEKLLEELPETAEAAAALRARVLAEPLYRNYVVGGDGRSTAIIIEPAATRPSATDGGEPLPVDIAEHSEILRQVETLTAPLAASGVKVHLAGHPVLNTVLQGAIKDDLRLLTPLSLLLSMLLLALLFRRLTGVIYPMLVVICSLVSTVGIMALLDLPFTNVSSALPSFLVVVGIADAVHILSVFYRRYRDEGDRRAAIVYAFSHSGLPVLMTSLTTAAGLLSFATADVAWVADFGLAAPIGVGFALLYTLLLLPALLALLPVRRGRPASAASAAPLSDRLLDATGRLAARRAWWIVWAWLAVFVVSAAGIWRLRISQDGMRWFPETHPLRLATEAVDRQLGGSLTFEVVIDTGKDNGVYDASLIKQLARSAEQLERYRRGEASVGKAMALSALIKEVHRALNEDRADHYRIPDSNAAVAQEILLFEMSGSNDLEDLVTTDLRRLRMTLTVPFADAVSYVPVVDDLRRHFARHYPAARVSITGMQVLFIETVSHVLTSMARSYPIALGVVSLLMILMLGRVRIGLLAMVPNLVPILIITGWMGWLGIPFDFSTMLIGSLAIGLVVDDTIHLLYGYVRERDQGKQVADAVQATLLSTGRAIFVTSAALAGGFFIYAAATLKNLVHFGTLIGSIVVVALVADLLLVPALLALAARRQTPG